MKFCFVYKQGYVRKRSYFSVNSLNGENLSRLLDNRCVDLVEPVADDVEKLVEFVAMLGNDGVRKVVEGGSSLRSGVNEVAEADIVELVLVVGRHMQVGDHVGEERQHLRVKGGNVEGTRPLSVDVVDEAASN